jgi:periplasmic protein CpxP/Spy
MNPFVKRSLIVAAILAGIAGVSATAIAQGAGPQAGQHAQRMEQMHKRHAEHQTQLKSALKVTASQEAAWNAYVAGTAPNTAMKAPIAQEDWAKLTTPQRMEKMQAFRAERDAVMTKRMEAVKTFYAALTPEQQKVFDSQSHGGFHRAGMKGEHRMGGKGGMGGHGERGGHHGMGMDGGGMGCDGPGAKRS